MLVLTVILSQEKSLTFKVVNVRFVKGRLDLLLMPSSGNWVRKVLRFQRN